MTGRAHIEQSKKKQNKYCFNSKRIESSDDMFSAGSYLMKLKENVENVCIIKLSVFNNTSQTILSK